MTVRVIADMGSCWRVAGEPYEKSWDRVCSLVESVKVAGAWSLKAQLYDGSIYPEGSREAALLTIYALPPEWIPRIAAECENAGIQFGCTVYKPEDVAVVDPYVAYHKLASFESSHDVLRRTMRSTGKPLILSTGGTPRKELTRILTDTFMDGSLTVLHCTSSYPAEPTTVNMRALGRLRHDWPFYQVGLSDHTQTNTAAVMAVAMGAVVIERHVKARDSGHGPDAHFASGPATFASYIAKIRQAEDMLGDPDPDRSTENVAWRYNAATGRRGTA